MSTHRANDGDKPIRITREIPLWGIITLTLTMFLAGGANVVAWWIGQRDLAAQVKTNQTTNETKLTELSKSIDGLVAEQRVQSKTLSDAAMGAVKTESQIAEMSRRLTRVEMKVNP